MAAVKWFLRGQIGLSQVFSDVGGHMQPMGWGGIGPTVYGADFIGQNQSRHPPVVIPQGYFAQTFMVPFLKTPLASVAAVKPPAEVGAVQV